MESKKREFTVRIEKNQGVIHKVCHIYTNDSESHNDLFQEIVLQLWRSYDSFKGDSKFSTWMYRVSLNTAITLFRKKSRQIETSQLSDCFHKIKEEEKDEKQEARLQLLYNSIKKLNDVERALVLLYFEDLSYREIADAMGLTEVNARVKMNRIKNKLKKIMNPTAI